MYNKILTVTAVNSYIKKVIDNDFILKNSNIKGELSNVKIHSSGHIYFSLKDNFTKLKCIMFKTKAMDLTFIPKDGMNVVVSGNISIYEKEGTYQLYCNTMEVEGEGELFIAFNLLKEKLEREGLFDINRKKEIPSIPRRIGVITSPTGAAIRDIIKVATRRNPNVDILIYPSLVQGINASKNIASGIKVLNNMDNVDVIILARGGGSIEELWAFNEEEVARAIATSKTPIITGVGHETDFTIADFVADLRAATPSHAAEVSVYSLDGFKEKLDGLRHEIIRAVDRNINEKSNGLNNMLNRLRLYSPENYVVNQYDKLENIKSKLVFTMELKLQEERNRLKIIRHRLIANNPLSILDRGYSIIKSAKNESIESLEELKNNELVDITMKDGHGLFKIEQMEE
jgi:exodeoxyribonuclease VII large subunit